MDNYLARLGKPNIEVLETKGECRWCKKGDIFTIDEMLPVNGLCPFAYHNLIPYIITLLNNGWFRWTKKEKDLNKRYLRTEEYFKDSSVNRAFPNEVLVQCPNPDAAVVMGVGIKLDGKKKLLTIRVLNKNSLCCAGHKKGDEFTVCEDDIEFPPLLFNTIFPYMMLDSFGGDVRFKNSDGIVSIELYDHHCKGLTQPNTILFKVGNRRNEKSGDCFSYKNQPIKATAVKSPCRYHSKPADIERVGPKGFCLDAFHAAYPYGLALLYDADFKGIDKRDSVSICCPSPKYKVIFEVKRIQTVSEVLKRLKNTAAKIFEKVFHPVDIINYKVAYKVLDVHGNCPAGHKVGEEFEFNIWDKKELCPASFHSIFPFLLLENQGIPFRWRDDSKVCEVPCPDCQGAVYQI